MSNNQKDWAYIEKNLDRIKASIKAGPIFRTEPSVGQWLELYLFEMFKAKRIVTNVQLCNWFNYNAAKNGHKTTNNTKAKEVCTLWAYEIDKHNDNVRRSQQKLFK